MPRRKIPILIAILALATLTASATDFWLTKDWHQWTKDECTTILNDSPWTRVEGSYTAQLRSALPIREAAVRQMQIIQNYENMDSGQRKIFDADADQILNYFRDDMIVIRVYFPKDYPGYHSVRDAGLYSRAGALTFNATIVSGNKKEIDMVSSQVSSMSPYSIDLYFPRLAHGKAIIKENEKLSFHLLTPQYLDVNGVNVKPRHITMEFDLKKMVVDGKFIY